MEGVEIAVAVVGESLRPLIEHGQRASGEPLKKAQHVLGALQAREEPLVFLEPIRPPPRYRQLDPWVEARLAPQEDTE
jgi:hypothetical protein